MIVTSVECVLPLVPVLIASAVNAHRWGTLALGIGLALSFAFIGLLNAGKYGKQVFGFVMLCLGVLIATGSDKSVEAWILDRTPDWLTAVTTRF